MARTTVVAGYKLTELLADSGELARWRGHGPYGLPVLVLLPVSDVAARKVVGQLDHEYALRDQLDPEWAVKPLASVRFKGRPVLAFADPGGEPLDRLCGQPMELRPFLTLAAEMALVLARVHEKGLVHRDVKPSNFFVDADTGRVHLTGFGFASRVPRQFQTTRPLETLVGTFAYMAPEQTGRMNCSVDSRADLYSLGVTFYELLSGYRPFQAVDPAEWVHSHIARVPPPLAERVGGVPQTVSDIVMKLLTKTVGERYQTAAGVAADLMHCLAALEASGTVAPFPLGRHDVSDRLTIPEKLYGRARETSALLAAFHRVVTSGEPELLLVSGYSGIGKSSLVNELHKAMVLPRALFGSGKFDQHKRDIPYATLAQAFQGLVRQILMRGKAEIAAWADAIQQTVGPNGQLVLKLIPELEFIIGAQPPIPELSSTESRNRFHVVFRQFVRAFATADHPLVLFLDDLQWLDPASLVLLNHLITHPDVRHLLLIGAYRDNEVGATHPLMLTIESLRKGGVRIEDIVLGPLTVDDLGHLVADTLVCDVARAAPLARLIHDKTVGNPFFSIQFMISLHEERLLVYDVKSHVWQPDIDAIRAQGYSDNVVELMVSKLGRLAPQTRTALCHLASLGNSSPFDVLTLIAGTSSELLEADIHEALSAGLVHREANTIAFAHDRIQEAAYSLIPEASSPAEHLRVGRLLAARSTADSNDDAVFDIVNQMNRGIALLTTPSERKAVRCLNVRAGRKAKASTAYASARSYLIQAEALLPMDAWVTDYAESYDIVLALSECEYLSGHLDRADALFNQLLEKSRSRHERARVFRLRMSLYQFAGRFVDAVDTVLAGLELFGMSFPATEADIGAAIQAERSLVPALLDGRHIADLVDAPPIDDPDIQAMLGILVDASPCVYIARPGLWPLILLKALNLSLRHGNTVDTCGAYSAYSILLAGVFADAPAAFAFSEMALALNERIPNPRLRAVLLYRHGTFVNNTLRPFSTSQTFLEQAFVASMDVGNLVYAGLGAIALAWLGLDKGDPLDEVVETARKYAAFAYGNGNTWAYHTARAVELFASGLAGTSVFQGQNQEGAAHWETCSAALAKGGFQVGIVTGHILEQMRSFLAGQYAEALGAAELAATSLRSVMAMACEYSHHFYLALTLAALHDEVDQTLRQDYRRRLTEQLCTLDLWTTNCPENFSARRALVAAEAARIDGEEGHAMRLYEEAIRAARENGSPIEEGLANEIASRFWRSIGFDSFADIYLRNARECFQRWGALAKVADIDRHHPGLEVSTAATPLVFGQRLQDLDIVSVVRASQAVSSEVVLDRLIEKLLTIVLEHAGAQRGLLIMVRGENPIVAAEATTHRESIEVVLRQSPPVANDLPISVLNFVMSTHQQALLDDASADEGFAKDDYLRQSGVRSVLCLPLVKQAKLVGVLYLENSLTVGAFNANRIALLELLASQAAISLDNASLYAELENRVAERTQALSAEVAERTSAQAQLHQALTELELILDNALLGIVIIVLATNGQRIIRQVNPALERMMGYDPGELNGCETRILYASEEEYQSFGRLYRSVLSEGRAYVGEHVYRRKDGENILTQLIGVAIDPRDLAKGSIFLVEDISERRHNEKLLTDTVRELEAFIHNSMVAILFTHDQKITRYNPRFSEMFGYPGDEGLGLPTRVLYPSQEDYEALGQKAFPLLSTGRPVQVELYLQRRDGQTLWVNVIGYVANPEQTAQGTIWIIEDRTDFKHADVALRRSHAELEVRVADRTAELSQQLHFLKQLIEAIPGPVFYKDAEARYLGCNSAFEAFVGKPVSELIGKTPHDIAPRELADKYLAADREILDRPGSQIYESPVRFANGEMRDVMFHKASFTRADGTVGGLVGVMLDITDRKRMEDELRQAAAVFESAAEGVIITTPEGSIMAVNRAFTKITGYAESEVIGLNPRILQSGRHDSNFYHEMWQCIARDDRWQGEIWNRRKNGEIYPESVSISVVRDTQGRVARYVSTASDISQQKKNEEQIQVLAFSDPLTRLPNRRLLHDRLQHALATSSRTKSHGALFFIDLDDFKTLNDTLGHDVGDLMLQQVGQRLSGCMRDGDTVARLGGDEFVVVLEALSVDALVAATQAESAGDKIMGTLRLPYQLANGMYHSTPSVGVTLFADTQESTDELLKRADLAMYQAKSAGRNTLRFFDPKMQAAVSSRAALAADLREAVFNNHFLLHYQAQVVGEGRLTGAEVLLRWKHPERGYVSPADFIPLAEETGLILPLGHWVLHTACGQLAIWAERPEMADLTIAVNVSARQFRMPRFVEEVLAVIEQTGANPQRLKLELTESLLVTDVEDIIAKMNALKAKGVGFSLDDFGTGYSSLSYLKRLPLDQMKIDQGFVRDILTDPDDAAIAKMVIALAESLGLAVIAEGVENEAQRDFLARQGCHAYQGYLYSRPLPLIEFEEFARRA